jgi:hypothetical protein
MDYLYYTYHDVNGLGSYFVEFCVVANSVIYENMLVVLVWA